MTIMVCTDPALSAYSFGEGHPFAAARFSAFHDELVRQGLDKWVTPFESALASQAQLEWFHDHAYVEKVKRASKRGQGFLDQGDTPAFPGVYEAAARVVGTSLKGLEGIMNGQCSRAFTPIAGLHHARRDAAAGFCVLNDCGVVIEALRRQYGIQRIAYIDIDAHHGDGVYYSFEEDPHVIIVDLHEDGRHLYPGTGDVTETGTGQAVGTKLNIPLPMGADDAVFEKVWPMAEAFLRENQTDFMLLQCGADSLAGDPITNLAFSSRVHAQVTESLCRLADEQCQGRLLAMGGGGYNLDNIASGWNAVVRAMVHNTGEGKVYGPN